MIIADSLRQRFRDAYYALPWTGRAAPAADDPPVAIKLFGPTVCGPTPDADQIAALNLEFAQRNAKLGMNRFKPVETPDAIGLLMRSCDRFSDQVANGVASQEASAILDALDGIHRSLAEILAIVRTLKP